MRKIVILYFKTNTVHVFPFEGSYTESTSDIIEFIKYINIKHDLELEKKDLEWMVTDTLNLQIHNII